MVLRRVKFPSFAALSAVLFAAFAVLFAAVAEAQSNIEKPESRYLFEKDIPTNQKLIKKRTDAIRTTDAPNRPDLDFKAPEVEFLKDKNVVKGEGGVLVSQGGVQAQADSATVNLDTKESQLEGGVLISAGEASIGAKNSEFNFETETGKFSDAEIQIEDGGYKILADDADKVSEFEYQLEDSCLIEHRL